jgi:hypothetical protein
MATVLAAGLTGCSGDSAEEATEPTTTPTTTLTADPTEGTEAAEADASEPFEPNVGDLALRVGETREGRAQRTTLIEIKYPYPPAQYREPQPGNQFLGLRIKQCMRPGAERSEYDYSTYNGDWYAVSPNGNQVAGSGSSWNDWPTPKFPESVSLNPGDCLTGWIAGEVPAGMKIEKLIWRPGGETTAEWLP